MKELYKPWTKKWVDHVFPEHKEEMQKVGEAYAKAVERDMPNASDEKKLNEFRVRMNFHARAVLY
ncbi:MAG: hypothetical protein ACLFR2_06790 [Candidatus Kapaibacterium sp.]